MANKTAKTAKTVKATAKRTAPAVLVNEAAQVETTQREFDLTSELPVINEGKISVENFSFMFTQLLRDIEGVNKGNKAAIRRFRKNTTVLSRHTLTARKHASDVRNSLPKKNMPKPAQLIKS